MSNKFKVNEREIPSELTIHLGLMERALFARMLTAYGISVDVAGDTFEHLLKTGLKTLYNERFPEDKV
jgi:hypothetical protein